MSRKRRVAALLCAALLFGLTSRAISYDGLCFVAAENVVLPLTEDTMPFWHDGYLYISSDVFTGSARDTLGVSRAKIGDGVLLYRGEQSLLFRRNYPYAQDTEQNTYAPGMVWHEDNAYVPAAVVARYFNLLYSTIDVERGKLVWLRNASFRMDDKAFAKAAAFQLDTAYQEYLKSLEPEELEELEETEPVPQENMETSEEIFPVTDPEPAPQEDSKSAPVRSESVRESSTPSTHSSAALTDTPVTPSIPASIAPPQLVTPSSPVERPVTPTPQPVTPPTSAQSVTPPAPVEKPVTPSDADAQAVTPDDTSATQSEPEPVPQARGNQKIYLCLRGDGSTSSLLDALDRHNIRATVFCDETFLAEQGDLLRRITATGYRVGLYVPAGPTASVLAQLETCNLLLQRTTMEKTRLVLIDGGGEDTLRAVSGAGFLCLRPDLNRADAPLRTSRQAADLLKLVAQEAKSVSVWLGGTVNRSGLNAFISDALERENAFLPWTETSAF